MHTLHSYASYKPVAICTSPLFGLGNTICPGKIIFSIGTSLNLWSLLVDAVCNDESRRPPSKCMELATELSELLPRIQFILYLPIIWYVMTRKLRTFCSCVNQLLRTKYVYSLLLD